MIKHRLVALLFRSVFLGSCVYTLYQILVEAKLYERHIVDEILSFPHYFIVVTIILQLYLIIKGVLQIKKQGMQGMTKLSPYIRGGFALTGMIMMLFYHLILAPSLLHQSVSLVFFVSYHLCGIFWLLDWFLFDERNQTKKLSPLIWLSIQVYLYVAIILIRASNTSSQNPYVYDILDIKRYGIAGVGKNIGVITGIYLLGGILLYLLDQLGKRNNTLL